MGDIKAAEGAATRARDLYAQLEADRERADAARLRSVALNDDGDILMDEGDRAGALKAYEESLEIARRLAAADPGNAGWARDVSVSLDRIGDVRVAEGDRAGALKAYEESLESPGAWPPPIPAMPAGRATSRSAWIRIGDVRVAEGDRAGALKAYEESLESPGAWPPPIPAMPAGRAMSRSAWTLGDVRVAEGDRAGALKAYEESLESPGAWPPPIPATPAGRAMSRSAWITSATCGWPKATAPARSRPTRKAWRSPGAWRRRSRQCRLGARRLGQPEQGRRVRVAEGDRAGALKAYEESLEIARRLAAADPGNAGWARDVSVSLNNVGDVRVAEGDRAGALKAYEESLDIARRLAPPIPAMPAGRATSRSAWTSRRRAGGRRRPRRRAQGLRGKPGIRRRLAAADPGNAGWAGDLIVANVKLANVADNSTPWCASTTRMRWRSQKTLPGEVGLRPPTLGSSTT